MADGIGLIGQMRPLDGYGFGLRQPGVMFTVRILPVPAERLALVDDLLCAKFAVSSCEDLDVDAATDDTSRALLRWVRRCLAGSRNPVLECARIEAVVGPVFIIVQPCLSHEACMRAIEFCVEILRWVGTAAPEPTAQALAERFGARSDEVRSRLEKGAMPGFNTIHFLKAAHTLGLPWMYLPGHVFQFGFGSAARTLNSSITGRTSNVSVSWARSKPRAAMLMRLAGLPVPQHMFVSSVAQAVRAAGMLGYPVVVKPADQDGGLGVSAGLRDAPAVERAYVSAAEHSTSILVEKHFEGRDYRLQVVEGEVQGILERVPGGVLGDGVHDVRTLIDRQNEERRTATDDRRHLHPIGLDDEALDLLADLGMAPASVPAAGLFVRLRMAANVAGGGVPVPMAPEAAHPDNLRLAVRAARVLGLDVAGIDLLIPDIARSWLETGAAICEVNAQPQMFTTMHLPMLRRLMGAAVGRIPVIVVLEQNVDACAVSSAIHQALREVVPSAALVTRRGLWLGDAPVAGPPKDLFDAGRAMLIDRGVDALVLEVSGESMLRRGWPIDRCDVLVLPDDVRNPGGPVAPQFLKTCKAAEHLRPERVLAGTGNATLVASARRAFGDRLTEIERGDAAEFARLAVAFCQGPPRQSA